MKYRVFLSSRGEDTTHTSHTFTAQLHKTLKDIGIHVFFDEVTLDKGEPLSQQRFPAIADSDISIIILSKDYASSKSCLNELSYIMDCKDRQGQIVIPIFYHVVPSDVQKLGGSFETSFKEHESERPIDEVKRWKSAFADVGTIHGWHINGDRPETKYIEDVKCAIEKLNSMSRNAREGLVGIDDQKKTILRLIKKEENRVIGLWGMDGCGKTALAEAVYDEISSEFDRHWFVPNFGMESVRTYLLSMLLKSENPSMRSTLTQQRLDNKRVLVVLDDVSDSDQILDMCIKYFGRGSKIIVTSRDEQVLKRGGADKILYIKPRKVWESQLDGMGGSGKTTLAEAVYNESNKEGVSWSIEQDQDEMRTKPSSSKDGNQLFSSLRGIPSDLHDLRIESSGIDDNQTVSPHASPSKVHKDQDETRTRPSSSEDENPHFSSSMEMPVDLHSLKIGIRESVDDQTVSPHASPSIAHQDQDETGTRPSSNEDGNQHFSSSLEMPSDLQNLIIERRESDDDQTVSPQVSPSIVHKDQDDTRTRPSSSEDGNHQFSSSTKMPSDLDTLRIERYAYCMLPKNILESSSLQHLYLIDCILLKSFPLSPSLKTLYIHNCKSLEFPPPNKPMNQLEDLCLGSSCDSLKIFPLSSFPKLKSLSLRDCRNLEYLSVDKNHNQLTSLEALEIKDCPKLRCFLEGEVTSSKLISLVFFNCVSLKSLQQVQGFKTLQSLHLNKCPALESFPNEGLPSGLIILCISFCDKIIPKKGWNLDKLHSLSHFEIEGGCQTMKSFPEEGLLPTNLNSLRISGLLNLTSLDNEGLQKLTSLRTLEINSCNTLHSLPERMPSSLYSLSITNCSLLNTKLRNRKEKEWSKIADIASIFLDEDSD